MKGTRQYILDQIIAWATGNTSQNVSQGKISWVSGLPGIGKTSLAHSICVSLLKQGRLAGAFFCQRGDPNLNKPRNILPTLIYKLAIQFPPFGNVVAERLRQEPHLTPESMNSSFFLDLLHKLPRHPEHTLVFVIDALDECGDCRSRSGILSLLTLAATQPPWLKVIVTSRPEVDIQHAFQALGQSSYSQYDLATDQKAIVDLRTFARHQFDAVALKWYLPTPWPEEADFDRVTSLANGLFIFIKTLSLAFEHFDPKESLRTVLQGSASTGLEPLYALYSSILHAQIVDRSGAFQRVIGVLLTTAPLRPLCEDTIAALAGVDLYRVKRWVDVLSSLLYRDAAANGVVRVRHLSISDYFVSAECPSDYRVNLEETNLQLSIACIKTMIGQLRFNICKLEDSRLANAEVEDLPSRMNNNIPDALQYSALYWSDHLCFTPDNDNKNMMRGCLKEFFEGLYPLFWIEVLSIMGMVPVGAPSLRRLISWLEVSRAPVYHAFTCEDHSHCAIGCGFCAS
jgi:hypothetical protein